MGDHHYLQPQNLMYNGYLQLSGQNTHSQHNTRSQNTSIVEMSTMREQLNQSNSERDQMQKELNLERQQKMQLQQEFQKAVQAQQELNYQCMTLRLEVAKYQQHQHFQTLQQQTHLSPNQLNQQAVQVKQEDVKSEVNHICDECQFETKSQVSLFVHKLNHSLGPSTPRHLHLPTRVYTTKNDSNVQFTYKCSACDDGTDYSKHEIYPHVYQFHSTEQPHKCPICLLYFTHADYLTEHKLDKHKMGTIETPGPTSSRGRGRGRGGGNSLSRSNSKGVAKGNPPIALTPIQTKSQTIQSNFVIKQEPGLQPQNTSDNNNKRKAEDSPDIICVSDTTPVKQMTPQHRTTTITLAKDNEELSCTYPGCGFTAPSKDRLQFHMSAHTQSKYKCPYCAYVGNILIDIRRHILKSKKHEGLNVFQCLKCDYGSDCERTFKDHLKKYHYGHNVEESALDTILEELFLNENNRQSTSAE